MSFGRNQDRRDRWVRFAEQQDQRGYKLFINDKKQVARWVRSGHGSLHCSFTMAQRIASHEDFSRMVVGPNV